MGFNSGFKGLTDQLCELSVSVMIFFDSKAITGGPQYPRFTGARKKMEN